MVSGFFTSPLDHARICSGEARPIRMLSKLFTSSKAHPPIQVKATTVPGQRVSPRLPIIIEDVVIRIRR